MTKGYTNEPSHDKMTCVPSEDSDQPGHPPSLIRVFTVHSMGSWGPKVSSCGQRRLWSDWADAQADLSLCWADMWICWFWGGSNLLCNIWKESRQNQTFVPRYLQKYVVKNPDSLFTCYKVDLSYLWSLKVIVRLYWGLVTRKLIFGFATRQESKRPVQL